MSRNEKNKKWLIVMAVVIVSFAFAGAARAGWLERQKLLASDGATDDEFGYSVSISGDYAIVGAYLSDGNGVNSGSAYIFSPNDIDPNNWVQQQKLLASDGTTDDHFGYSVSISGDLAIVGANGNDANGSNSGSAYIFKWDGASWSEQAKLLAADGAAGDEFGYSVSISGDYAIVGANRDDDKGGDSGSAYIFKRVDANWVQQAKLLAADGNAEDWFGCFVSISGDFAIVGAMWDDDKGNMSGSAYIFKREGETWSQQARLLAADGAAEDWFGRVVSISGDYAIVGANGNDDNGSNSGSAYIFKREGETWSQQAKLLATDGDAQDFFGHSVSISGDYAIVAALGDDDKGNMSGSAYIFKRNGETWSQQAKMLASDGAAEDQFGMSVSISGDLAVVGTNLDDDKGNRSGSAYIFNRFCPRADLNGDCKVDFADFAIFADSWLYGTD
jgi:hypothetical protein